MTWNSLTGAKSANGSIKRWVNYDKVEPEEVIAEAESWMALHLRTRDMEARVDDLDLALGDDSLDLSVALPDFLDPISLFLVGFGYLDYRSKDELDEMRWPDPDDQSIADGTPTIYTVIGSTALFNCSAEDDFTLIATYFARPAALSLSNQSNIYTTTKYRVIFKQALLGFAYQLPKDEKRGALHLAFAEKLINKGAEMDDLILRAQMQINRVS